MLSNTVVSAIVLFSSVCGFVIADTNGSEGIPNEEERYYDYYYPEAINVTNTLTTKDVEKLINDGRAFTKRQVLTDPELISIIKDNFKTLVAKRIECVADDLHYYDFEIPDCKSCLRIDCDMDETCRAECHGTLEMKRQKQAFDVEKNSNEQLKIKYQQLAEKQSQNEGSDNARVVGMITLAIFTTVNLIAVIGLAVLVGIMWKKSKEPKHVSTFKPKDDEEEERKGMMNIENEGDRDSGTGSNGTLTRDQNAAT